MSPRRWLIVALLLVLVVGLLAYARGPDHRRGDEVGEEALKRVAVVTVLQASAV